jgi:hypothetical protein
MEHIARAESLSCPSVFGVNVFTLFNVEKQRSLSTVVIGIVQIIFNNFTVSRNTLLRLLSQRNWNM